MFFCPLSAYRRKSETNRRYNNQLNRLFLFNHWALEHRRYTSVFFYFHRMFLPKKAAVGLFPKDVRWRPVLKVSFTTFKSHVKEIHPNKNLNLLKRIFSTRRSPVYLIYFFLLLMTSFWRVLEQYRKLFIIVSLHGAMHQKSKNDDTKRRVRPANFKCTEERKHRNDRNQIFGLTKMHTPT